MPAKGTVRFKLTPALLAQAEAAAARGLDHNDIARVLGISITTLYAHKAKNEEFAEAIKQGKAKGHLALADAVYNKAKAGNMDAAKLILSRRYGGTKITRSRRIVTRISLQNRKWSSLCRTTTEENPCQPSKKTVYG